MKNPTTRIVTNGNKFRVQAYVWVGTRGFFKKEDVFEWVWWREEKKPDPDQPPPCPSGRISKTFVICEFNSEEEALAAIKSNDEENIKAKKLSTWTVVKEW